MGTREEIEWFKGQFSGRIAAATAGTPFPIDFLAAIAFQETGYIWSVLRRKGKSLDEILALCVGDTLDASGGRKAFPRDRAALEAVANGRAMFMLARQSLEKVAALVPGFSTVVKNPNKFCRGYGVFQLDLQFFKSDPEYFLQQRWRSFEKSLGKCLEELQHARKKIGYAGKTALTDLELTHVAIAYNTGKFVPSKGLKQGYKPKNGRHYGENVFDYIKIARGAQAGRSSPSAPTPVIDTGATYRVETLSDSLQLRSAPVKTPPGARSNRRALLPKGHLVRALDSAVTNGFRHVETSLAGALYRGYASADFLKKVAGAPAIPVLTPQAPGGPGAIPAVNLARKRGAVTRRTDLPRNGGAYPLNEPGQPKRQGSGPEALRAELGKIVQWLDVGNAKHLRYQPTKATFCNIYAYDFCHLAGAYLPRVWWTGAAIQRLARGETVEAAYDSTVDEQRANDLFRWLRDFGPQFGWRRTGTLTKLQSEVNGGAVGIIVARRTMEAASGHIVVVVPETDQHRAKRNGAGEVLAPLQSQAGRKNFRYGNGRPAWWAGAEMAEHAFWIHP